MNAWIKILVASFGFTSFAVQAITLKPLIDSFELVELVDASQVKVLEVRSNEKLYIKRHIPGSIHMAYSEFRGPDTNPGKLPEMESFAQSLGVRGLSPSDAVVIVHDGVTTTDFGSAARVYWTLKSFGFKNLAILNGGFRSYQKNGFRLTSDTTKVTPKVTKVSFNDRWYADTDEVKKQVLQSGNMRLLDARADDFFAGTAWHDAAARPGILPGAEQFSFEQFFDKKSPLLMGLDEVTQIVRSNNLDRPGIISYCNTGHWAATNWFVLSEIANVDDVKLYAESMVEWSADNNPMENVPTPLQFAILKTKKWFGNLVN
jgi:thiosulfate/3-mercaptopyruvate sulfurtransferase